jgi:hypothetical protein
MMSIEVKLKDDNQFPIETIMNQEKRKFTIKAATELRDKLIATINRYHHNILNERKNQ